MILNARNKKPKIGFGLGKTELSILESDTATVWIDSVFNMETYRFLLSGVPVVKVSNYQYQIEPLPAGSYEINVSAYFINDRSKAFLKSNTLTLIVE